MVKRKKEQVMIEYLMTYGWAILVVLIFIGILAYFGAFDMDKFLPDKNKKEFVIKMDLKEEVKETEETQFPCAEGRECIDVCKATLLVMQVSECRTGCTEYKGKLVGTYELKLALESCEEKEEHGSCNGQLIIENGLHLFEDYGELYGWVYKGLSKGNSFWVTKDCEWCNNDEIMICGELNWTDKPRCTDILYEFYFPCEEEYLYAYKEKVDKEIIWERFIEIKK